MNVPNLWNPVGNPWKRDDSIFVHCYEVISSKTYPDGHCPSSDRDQCGENIVVVGDTCQEEVWPEFDCSCQRLNISSSARVQEYHPGICLSSKYHPDIYLSSKYHPGIYFSSKYHPGIYLCLTTN